MTCDYEAIRQDNKRRYGEDIARVGKLLLADRYRDRTHFIYELLQNAEDALRRRPANWNGSRTVSFDLDSNGLRVAHFGEPFSDDDVRAICGIGQNDTKSEDLTSIGRFGIGFKSVYAFTDRPEIHSDMQRFAIEDFVHPVATTSLAPEPDQTVISIPFRPDDDEAKRQIEERLAFKYKLMKSLLFLREVKNIQWNVDGVEAGTYSRESRALDKHGFARRVRLRGVIAQKLPIDTQWLLFSRPIYSDGTMVGYVQIAWSLGETKDGHDALEPVQWSRLCAFFPTGMETGMGFLMQGPYRTTLTREGVPFDDEWNQDCLRQTQTLLVKNLHWLTAEKLLNWNGLACLPTDAARFRDHTFRALFDTTKETLLREDVLPALHGGATSARRAWLANSPALQDLLPSDHLSALHGGKRSCWLDLTVSEARTRSLHLYLTRELGIQEFKPSALLTALRRNGGFLSKQTDEWIQDLYEFLGTQPHLHGQLSSLPIIRLADGSQVPPPIGGRPKAFLPGPAKTDFPTVRPTVCQTDAARKFLTTLGLKQWDEVDHVLRYLLPKYRSGEADLDPIQYAADIERIVDADKTASLTARRRLVAILRKTPWVRSVAGTGRRTWAAPTDLCLFSEKLRSLFDGVDTVLFSDPDVDDLSRNDVCRLLRRCGASDGLLLRETGDLLQTERRQLRKRREHEDVRVRKEEVKVKTIHGLAALIALLPTLDRADRAGRSRDLWEALCVLIKNRVFGGLESVYSWKVSGRRYRVAFDAEFVDILNAVKWVPDAAGELQVPSVVTFDSLGWEKNDTLLHKIPFKQVQEPGGEGKTSPGVLAVLEKTGLATDAARLLERLEVSSGVAAVLREEGLASDEGKVREAVELLKEQTAGTDRGGASPGLVVEPFVAGPDDSSFDDRDPPEQEALLDLEKAAISFILEQEPEWETTDFENPGFDLYQGDTIDAPTHRCEVKAIAGSIAEKLPTLSRTQFQCAQKHRENFWLYVVERAGKTDANLVRIQNPAARAVILDKGDRAVAWIGTK